MSVDSELMEGRFPPDGSFASPAPGAEPYEKEPPRSPQSALLFLLTPVNITHPDWEGSSRTEPVYVIAWSSENAKEIASRHYAKDEVLACGEHIVYQPWWNMKLVRTERTTRNGKWPVIGQEDTPVRFETRASTGRMARQPLS